MSNNKLNQITCFYLAVKIALGHESAESVYLDQLPVTGWF